MIDYEDPNYGLLIWPADNPADPPRVEVLTCLEPECERGPCKQPDEHERWFQPGERTAYQRIHRLREGSALRHDGFAVLCRNCRHWRREFLSESSASCTKAHPYNDAGKPAWPRTIHDQTCGEWEPSARIVRITQRRRLADAARRLAVSAGVEEP